MKVGDVYKRKFENIYLKLVDKKGSDYVCLILENDMVPEIKGTQCTIASWILAGNDWIKTQ